MKQFLAVIVLAVVASVCGAQQKTVKPALPQPTPADSWSIGGMFVTSLSGPCGNIYDYKGALILPDKDGVCRQILSLHFGPDDADCRFVSSADGKTLNVTCAWKPTKEGAK